MFSRILIANRGEIALRIIRACHELGIEAVVVYSEADKDNSYVKLADDAICVGPAAVAESYLNIPAMENYIKTQKLLKSLASEYPGACISRSRKYPKGVIKVS